MTIPGAGRPLLRRPFAGAVEVMVVGPRAAAGDAAGAARAAALAALLRREPRELEVELGAPVRFAADDPGMGARFLVGPVAAQPEWARYGWRAGAEPALWLDRAQEVLIADAPDVDGVLEAINLLRTLGLRGADTVVATNCRDLEEAIGRIVEEVGGTYPSFALRRLDWAAICARHVDAVRAAADPLVAMQRWLAELEDVHTWARALPPPLPLPYALWVTPTAATFARVPPETAAWAAGVRPGDQLADADAAGWWARTGAPAHARPFLAGRRLLAGPAGVPRAFVATSPAGARRAWSETPSPTLPFPVARWTRLASGTGYLQIAGWRAADDLAGTLDAAFADLAGTDRLIVDLRGNAGGDLGVALAFRDRFVRTPAVMGSIRFSTGDGGLSAPQVLRGAPAPAAQRWPGAVRFLTDLLTASSSEDALLGLQGLAHVLVVGEPSCGGSGRPRTVRLLAGQVLTVSTALTYDRAGRCIEGAGIPVDVPVVPDRFAPDAPDAVLLAADREW